MPAIDPFSAKNADLTEDEIKDRLGHCNISDDLPIVAQISRYDRWKDHEGLIEAFKIARKQVPATWVLLGNMQPTILKGRECSSRFSSTRKRANLHSYG